jgi:hypothetical protein
MIYSPGRKYLFLHIPKTGGTSLALALEARAMKDDTMLGDTPKAVKRRAKAQRFETKGRLWKHSRLVDLEGMVPAEVLPDLMVVTLVRNPWDRLVSYYHWLREQSFDHPVVQLAQALEFSAFLNAPHTMGPIQNSPVRSYTSDATGRDWLTHAIRLEHLAEDLAPFEAHLGFSLDLPHVNRSSRTGGYRDFYSKKDQELVSHLCAEDIARFGYSFD